MSPTRLPAAAALMLTLTLTLTPASRYLRARKFSPPDALKQFKDTEDWRKENSLDELYDTIEVKEYEETRRLVSSTPRALLRPPA